MAEKNFNDRVIDIVHDNVSGAQEKIKKQFKGTNPFRQEPISKEEMLVDYENMTQGQLMRRIQTYGYEAVDELIKEMEEYKQRRKK